MHISPKASASAKPLVGYCGWFQAPQPKTDSGILEWVLQSTNKMPGVAVLVVFWRCAEAPFHWNYFIILFFSPSFFLLCVQYPSSKPNSLHPILANKDVEPRKWFEIWFHQIFRCGLRQCFCTSKTEAWPSASLLAGRVKDPMEDCKGQWGFLAGADNSEPPFALPIAELQAASLSFRVSQIGSPKLPWCCLFRILKTL